MSLKGEEQLESELIRLISEIKGDVKVYASREMAYDNLDGNFVMTYKPDPEQYDPVLTIHISFSTNELGEKYYPLIHKCAWELSRAQMNNDNKCLHLVRHKTKCVEVSDRRYQQLLEKTLLKKKQCDSKGTSIGQGSIDHEFDEGLWIQTVRTDHTGEDFFHPVPGKDSKLLLNIKKNSDLCRRLFKVLK